MQGRRRPARAQRVRREPSSCRSPAKCPPRAGLQFPDRSRRRRASPASARRRFWASPLSASTRARGAPTASTRPARSATTTESPAAKKDKIWGVISGKFSLADGTGTGVYYVRSVLAGNARSGDVTDLAKIDPTKAKLVELRYFGGLTFEETAEVMGVSVITVKRHWRMAKAWLYGQLTNHS